MGYHEETHEVPFYSQPLQIILSDKNISNAMNFIQTVIYSGKNSESYVDTRVRLYENQRTKSSLYLPPDPDSCNQYVKRAHHQIFTWKRCTEKIIPHIDFKNNGWTVEPDGAVVPLFYTSSQLPPSKTAKQKAEHKGAMMNPKPTKRRRTSQDSCMNTSNHEDTTVENISDENDENDAFNSATNYDDSVHDESDFEWECLSEFSSSDSETDSEDSDWDP